MTDAEIDGDPNGETSAEPNAFERLLGAVTEVRAGEGTSAVLLTLNVFLLLTSYYIIKPVRDSLITAMPNGPQYKSYMNVAVAIALLGAVPLYARFAKKLPANRLVVGVTLFFTSHIVLFAFATQVPGSENWLPLVFYLWVGIFNMMVIAQFWAFANDLYNEEQGKRLFALIGVGASVGAAAGSYLAKVLPRRPVPALTGESCSAVTAEMGYLGTFGMLMVAACILGFCALLPQVVFTRERAAFGGSESNNDDAEAGQDAIAKDVVKAETGNPFAMVFRYRYLWLLALFALLFTFVNSNGEFMLSKLLKGWVGDIVSACNFTDEAKEGAYASGLFTSWYGDFYFYVNVFGVLLQSFIVSRLIKKAGMGVAFFVMPTIALFGAMAVAVVPMLAVLRPAKIAENSTDYSLNNTLRNMLWLPTTRAMKYQAKQAVDTFFVRMGDVSSAALVFVLAGQLKLGVRAFAIINVGLILVWFLVARAILKEQVVLKAQRASGEIPDEE